jgi:ATP-dependent helicase IRC3
VHGIFAENNDLAGVNGAANIPEPSYVTYIDYDNPFFMAEDASGSLQVTRLSQNAWISCGGDTYVLDCLGHGFIKIQLSSEGGLEFSLKTLHIQTN